MNSEGEKKAKVDASCLSIEDLLPHRGRMKLVDKILELTAEIAVTSATATRQWPLFDGRGISPLVLVELVAQTAGIKNGLDRMRTQGPEADKRGWIVGIKQARFEVDEIYPGDRVITRAWNDYQRDNYLSISGEASIGSRVVARVSLQVVQAAEAPEE